MIRKSEVLKMSSLRVELASGLGLKLNSAFPFAQSKGAVIPKIDGE